MNDVPPFFGVQSDKLAHFVSLELAIGSRAALPTNRELAIINAKRKIKIWKKANDIKSAEDEAVDVILKAYNLVWEEENFQWEPRAMVGLRDWWGDTDEETEKIVSEFRDFLAISPLAQKEALQAIDSARRQWIQSEMADLILTLEQVGSPRLEFAQEFMENYGHMIAGDIFKFFVVEEELCRNLNDVDEMYDSISQRAENYTST